MTFRLIFLLWCAGAALQAQTTIGLVAHYRFDGDFTDATGNTGNTGIPLGTPEFVCGVDGQAVLLDGGNDQVRVPVGAGVNREFDTEDFTVSFYFKSVGFDGIQYLLSKRDTACADPRKFYLRYVPNARTFNAFLAQDEEKDAEVIRSINNFSCWQHIVLVRDGLRVKLYLNGRFIGEDGTASRVDIETPGDLYIGGSTCLTGVERPFAGLIDEMRIYNRALDEDEITGLFLRPDQILTNDTIMFLNTALQIDLANTCGTSFLRTPDTDVMLPTDAEPIIDPSEAGQRTYYVQISDQVSACVATDSVQVTVIDPDELPCEAFLPRAFTPNGDNLNDTYGISNPYAIEELLSFEIFDRWGGQVFYTEDPFERWDATFHGDKVMPGVFLWRVRYRCDGAEQVKSGNVTVLR
ncbi:MAG: gliding motility-associated C-terminal domain-containing protein [Lewinella sp.]|nr:gliding motility-associated C-terminal domain-containing protein [Lewinella sp.]